MIPAAQAEITAGAGTGLVNADIRQLAVALDYADALTTPADCD
jgi:hypothetical protein